MSELIKNPNNYEKESTSNELSPEKIEQLNKSTERAEQLSPRDAEALQEKSRQEALEKAKTAEKKKDNKPERQSQNYRRSAINKKDLNRSYKNTVRQIQGEMKTSSRVFSKFIHNGFVEKTSDIAGSTIARPNSMLYGSFFAFLLTLIVYVLAKNLGYTLSGFETIAAFIFGWVFGIIVDYLKVLFTGKKF